MNTITAFLGLWILLIAGGNCNGQKEIPTYGRDHTAIRTVPGTSFAIRLRSYYGGGYRWETAVFDTMVVHLDSTAFVRIPPTEKDSSDIILSGTDAWEVFYFTALDKGEAKIQFKQVRPWEKYLPRDSVSFHLEIH